VEGTGLGLAIAARTIRLMGGSINYDANPNGGSVFWFELPAGKSAPPSPEPVMVASARSGRPVLLVDDIKINRDIIGAFLDAAGHAVILAEGGEEAVRLAAEQQFDVILMDVRMPKVDGLQATRRIRTLPGAQGQVPILALTAYTFPDQVAQCVDAGMDGHLPKPVDYKTLIDGIDEVIARVSAGKLRGDPEDAAADHTGDGPVPLPDRDRGQGQTASGVWPTRVGADARVSVE
jgi:CheY-like chemotaxis protein